MMNRKGDRRNLTLSVLGVVIAIGGIVTHGLGASDLFALGCIFAGGVMVQGGSLIDLVRAFRKHGNGQSSGGDGAAL